MSGTAPHSRALPSMWQQRSELGHHEKGFAVNTRVKETDEWKLAAFIEWRPKPMSITCPLCHGEGTIGGGFKDIDGPRDCPECWGTKVKSVAATSPKPDVPADLIEHMRRAWWDYFNAPQPTKEAEKP